MSKRAKVSKKMPRVLDASITAATSNSFSILDLSDEVLLLIVHQLDRHDSLLQARLTCKKLKDLSDSYMYRNVMVTLEEEVSSKWTLRLQCVPEGITKTKHLSILNQSKIPGGFFHSNCVPQRHSYRILRWRLLEEAAEASHDEFSQAAFFKGNRFNWKLRLAQNQLTSFRWRHATTLSLSTMRDILVQHSNTLEEIECAMITPPTASEVRDFVLATASTAFPKLHTIVYNGLSHTEPIPANNPERGGRFRMLRPLFRKAHENLRTLTLSQDHCISQIGKTPLINGRVYDSFTCDLDEIYTHPQDLCDSSVPSVFLKLASLELGGFRVASLFDTPVLPTVPPRVRIRLAALRRLVLNDCDGLSPLLQELTLRHEEVHLTQIGIRVQEDLDNQDYTEVSKSLAGFLISFKGLEILSVLWDGPNAPESSVISAALPFHAKTLQVYCFVARNEDDDDSMDATLRFVSKHKGSDPWTKVLPQHQRPNLKEFSLNVPECLAPKDYPCLRLLSQFETLRTVHIRNFPPLHNIVSESLKHSAFWRDRDGYVSQAAKETAIKFAETIALPFYGLPKGFEEDTTVNEMVQSFDLQSLAKLHAAKRDRELLGGVKLRSVIQTSTPKHDVTRRVLEQRADIDNAFRNIMQKVENDEATAEESSSYFEYVARVRKALGYTEPSQLDKPKLRLLIVGEWRYRDQLNLTGPRTWDPSAWCLSSGDSHQPPSSITRDYSDDDSQELLDLNEVSGNVHYKLRSGFKMEFDVSLLPLFFAVDWQPKWRKQEKRWRWKANVRVLDQSTLEGYATLGDVRSLDFATQN